MYAMQTPDPILSTRAPRPRGEPDHDAAWAGRQLRVTEAVVAGYARSLSMQARLDAAPPSPPPDLAAIADCAGTVRLGARRLPAGRFRLDAVVPGEIFRSETKLPGARLLFAAKLWLPLIRKRIERGLPAGVKRLATMVAAGG